MKKTSKFLALILSSVTLFSHVGVVGAVKHKTTKPSTLSSDRLRKQSVYGSLTGELDEALKFEGEVLTSGMSLESEIGNTFVTKGEISSFNARKMTKTRGMFDLILRGYSRFYVNRGLKLDKGLCDNFESFFTILTVMFVHRKNRIEKSDIISLLCIAQRKGVEIPDLINFNSVNMYCNSKIAIFSLKKDGRQVFGFSIPIESAFDK